MKKLYLILIVAALVALALFAACSGSLYRDDVAVSDICDKVGENVPGYAEMTKMDEAYLRGAMKMDPSKFSEYVVCINPYGSSIDEFGIFKASGKDHKEALKEVEGYLQLRRDTWMNEYLPEEKPKLEAAVAKADGLYVMYVILDEESRIGALAAFDSSLLK
ncbi:MAG: DUF4358 domain-containing protein [Oscillospiraceae bacterium]|nr:DUF4358 domain-containing protein [Oscillospiraceae bacterium]